jgi:hypothetical protein
MTPSLRPANIVNPRLYRGSGFLVDADRWAKAKTLLEGALERQAGEQHAYVERDAAAAGFDDAMPAELHALLAADQAARSCVCSYIPRRKG